MKNRSGFQFKVFYFDRCEYRLNEHYIDKGSISIEATFDYAYKFDEERNVGLVRLGCIVFDNFQEKNYPFFLSARIIGEFESLSEMDSHEFEKFCKINGTATLFPFLRSFLTNVSVLAGSAPLVLPLVNIYDLFLTEEKKNAENKEKSG